MHRCWDDFQGSWNVKNEQKRGRVVLFLIFGGCNIRRRFGAVLGESWAGFWQLFWAILAGFWGFERRPILKPKLEAEKVVSATRGGIRRLVPAALTNIDR